MSAPSRRARRAGLPLLIASAALALAACSGAGSSDPPTAASPGSTEPAPSAAIASPTPTTASPAASPTGSPATTGSAISISNFEFQPATLTVPVGTTVSWTNDEDALHTATSGTPDDRTGLFDSGEIDTGVSFEVTFDEAGTFPFFCDRHEFMRGEITVAP